MCKYKFISDQNSIKKWVCYLERFWSNYNFKWQYIKPIETAEADPNFGINKEGMNSSDVNLVINPDSTGICLCSLQQASE